MKPALFLVVAAALGLSACAEDYGYAYDYDPYLGPRGHHVGPFSHRTQHAALACSRYVFTGPYDGGWRGPYYAGPYCVQDEGRAVAPVAEAAVVATAP
ncbi:MAG TPA: hypothetical protein VHV27_05220 [Phenylobacterium sp.]|jgi:hypothetical protein|nr:hypothetical protein [Phenylobacterium sp.]